MVTMTGGYELGDVGQAWILFSGASDAKGGYIYIYIYMIEAYKIMRVRDRVESQDLFSQGGNVKD